jgi:hypothetical protein
MHGTDTHALLHVAACRIFLHHYQEYMDVQGFDEASECLQNVVQDYQAADSARPTTVTRLRPKGLTFL